MKKFLRQCVQFFDSWFALLLIPIIMRLPEEVANSTFFSISVKVCLCIIIVIVQILVIIFTIM